MTMLVPVPAPAGTNVEDGDETSAMPSALAASPRNDSIIALQTLQCVCDAEAKRLQCAQRFGVCFPAGCRRREVGCFACFCLFPFV